MLNFRRRDPSASANGEAEGPSPPCPASSARREDPRLALAELPTPQQTVRMIQREEALRSRGRPPFSVVVLTVGLPGDDPGLALRLLRLFRRRARISDEIGWIGPDQIALILPLTPRDGAMRFAEEICARLGSEGDALAFQVFTP